MHPVVEFPYLPGWQAIPGHVNESQRICVALGSKTLSNHEHIMQLPSEDESHNHDDADDRRCLLLLFQ